LANVNGETRDITTSDSIGAFSFEGLPAGTYEMRVLHAGFRPFVDSQVVLISGRDFTRNAALAMGAVNERIEVTAEGGLQPLKKATGGPIRVGGNVSAANLIVKVPPVYPASAKAARIQGAVLLQAEIQADGTVGSLRVMNSQIDPDLARSAVDGVKQWRYRPTMLNGEPVAVETAITVNFTLAQ
jgi:TonB family protein